MQRLLYATGFALISGVLMLAGCGATASRSRLDFQRAFAVAGASPLTVFAVPTPPLRVPGYDTSGTYPQVKGRNVDLRAVNAALRAAVLADQRAYTPYARRERKSLERNHRPVGDWRGVYRTAVDRKIVSASTVVVSALLPAKHEVFVEQPGGDGWLSMTVRVPSGTRVTISDLFKNLYQGLGVLEMAWKTGPNAHCARTYWRSTPPRSRTTATSH